VETKPGGQQCARRQVVCNCWSAENIARFVVPVGEGLYTLHSVDP
jgi:hypothetical protein